ncbi:MAG: prolipoprotein diacylglyceryl transferase [Bacteroidales bacterium]|nr:prolipoprotein diacylglyceryl transferase [Bacteroidales bacterium]
MAGYIIWDVGPDLFSLGTLSIRWYGLLFALAFIAGYLIMGHIFRLEQVPAGLLDKLTTWMVIGTVVGARLGHCFFYEPEYYLANPARILRIWEGGLASHGAAIGILAVLWFFSRKSGRTWLWIVDRIVIVVALSGFFIRTGNLINSEIYGDETSLPWGFVFVRTGETFPRHPTQIYEGVSYLIIFILLYRLYLKKGTKLREGTLFGLFLTLLFSVRFLIEFIKEPQVGFESGMMLNMGQLLSIPFIILGIWLLWRSWNRKDRGSVTPSSRAAS